MLSLVLLKPSFENLSDGRAIWVTVFWIFLHHFHTDTIEFTGAVWAIGADICGHDVLMFCDPTSDATVRKRRMSRQKEIHLSLKQN